LADLSFAVPEPGTISLVALGGLALAGMHWRRRSRRSIGLSHDNEATKVY
jgi:predicted transporter